jgi:anaerobic selenocysteine-containing dehydrogenase
MGQCRTIYEICSEIAKRMGVEQEFTEGRSHNQWVEHLYYQCRKVRTDLPETYGVAVRKGIFKWKRMVRTKNRFELFRENPNESPLDTPSGKIEIFSKRLWDIARKWKLPEGDMISALPEYHETWGMPSDIRARKYPLQLIGHHCKQRTHSSYGNNPWLQETILQSLWINPLDAEPRNIAHGDIVRVYNQIGQTVVHTKITPRIMPGVLSLPQGAWYTPDEKGIDKNGSINILTSQRPSPLAKGNPQHTNLVDVEKV